MKAKYFASILILFASYLSQASVVKGILKSESSEIIPHHQLFLNNGMTTQSKSDGHFEFDKVLKGTYIIYSEIGGQNVKVSEFEMKSDTSVLDIGDVIIMKTIQLKDVFVSDKTMRTTIERMPDIKGTMIYAGKKTEVVKLSAATSNLAQNSSRQIFSKVPGVQVWESDGSGVQMGIATRGLSPNRMWEFNTRQNGYDMAADPFGYPEAYYTPSVESLERIEIIRGAASLQYGPQFGGMLNYVKKQSISGKKIGIESTQTYGSNNMFSSFNAIGGTYHRFSYYANINYRRSDGWRANNNYHTWNGYVNFGYQINSKIRLNLEYTRMDQLVKQPGGLTDSMFASGARQSVRSRNWFNLAWNIPALQLEYAINHYHKINVKVFGLIAERSSIGMLSPIQQPDTISASTGQYSLRTIDQDKYTNAGVEVRYLFRYAGGLQPRHSLATGVRYYEGRTLRIQNKNGNRGSDYNLNAEASLLSRDLSFGTKNMAFFAENLFAINARWSITPGLRYEVLENTASGIQDAKSINRSSARRFLLMGIGSQYRVTSGTNIYANITQCYRPVLFSDISVPTTDSIDADLKDASGYNADLGYRGNIGNYLHFDIGVFYLSYQNRVGTYTVNGKQFRTNIGSSVSKGFESYVEFIPTSVLPVSGFGQIHLFASLSAVDARYVSWKDPDPKKNQEDKKVENAPSTIQRYGITWTFKGFSTTVLHSYVGSCYADPLNTREANAAATVGFIPAYEVTDWSFSFAFLKAYRINGGVNNVFDKTYFTRRSGGYPGPGLLPADGRLWYIGAGIKF